MIFEIHNNNENPQLGLWWWSLPGLCTQYGHSNSEKECRAKIAAFKKSAGGMKFAKVVKV